MSNTNEFTPPEIITYDYYTAHYILPLVENTDEQKTLINRWIIQCQDQIDTLCGGRVYAEYPELDLTKDKDKRRAYYLKKAVCALLEYYIDTGKAFVDKNFSSASNVPANINASTDDANFEHKRKDIIKLLTQGGWYETFMTYTNAEDLGFNKPLAHDFSWTDFMDKLSEVFKRLDNNNSFTTNQVMNNHNISHIKELIGYHINTSVIRNFKLVDCLVPGYQIELVEGDYIDIDYTDPIHPIISAEISVSDTGTSTDTINYLTLGENEYKLAGGKVEDVKQNGTSVLDPDGIANIDAYTRAEGQQKVHYGSTAPTTPQDNDIWVNDSIGQTTNMPHLYQHVIKYSDTTMEVYKTVYCSKNSALTTQDLFNLFGQDVKTNCSGHVIYNNKYYNICGIAWNSSTKFTFYWIDEGGTIQEPWWDEQQPTDTITQIF